MAIDLLRKLDQALPAATRDALVRAIAAANERGLSLALVGGAVRDLLLGEAQIDVDLVVDDEHVSVGASGPRPQAARAMDGTAIDLAEAVASDVGGSAVAHRRFGTATVRLPEGRLDVARARSERYQRPGALPEVAPAGLEDDLARRDFTINAMALRLSGESAIELVDPHGGQADLARRHIRILHETSFQDDATRILRALRYAGRLSFELSPDTNEALDRDLGSLATITGARLRRELERVALEDRVGGIARAFADRGVLAAIDPALRAGDRELCAIAEIVASPASHRDVLLFSAVVWQADTTEVDRVVDRLALTGRQAGAVRDVIALRDAPSIASASRPSEVTRLLDRFAPLAVEAFALLTDEPHARERANEYLVAWRHLRPRLSGRDVEALGVAHGPAVGEAIARLRAARLDGKTESRDDEVALVARMRQGSPAGASRG